MIYIVFFIEYRVLLRVLKKNMDIGGIKIIFAANIRIE
tara:strand:+ start:2746 stop:2859 length:114 start_codon:yes stop_codon:yes gene_type:complete